MKKNKWFLGFFGVLLISLVSCGGPKERLVEIQTDYGVMKVRLFNSTPIHRDNFIKLAEEGFYDGTLFHRVIHGFMIQGGDPDSRNAAPGQILGNGGPGYDLAPEIGAIHTKGALAAARLPDNVNPERRSSGSQFYIVHGILQSDPQLDAIERQKGIKYTPEQRELYRTIGGAPNLDMEYTVFGEVIEGLDVIDLIALEPSGRMNRPGKDVKMTVKIIQ